MKQRLQALILAALMLLTVLSGCSTKPQKDIATGNTSQSAAVNQTPQPQATKPPEQEVWKAALYFSDKDAMYILKEEREIKAEKKLDSAEKAKIALEELIKGAQNKELTTTIPKNTKVRSVSMDKDTAVIDLSKEFVSENVGGSAGETMAIAPIVLTLTGIEGIKQVLIKIDGNLQGDFRGHMTLDRPFKASDFSQFLSK